MRDERGVPKIGDPELADREWEENTRSRGDDLTEALNVPDYLVSSARRAAAAALRDEAQAD